MTAQPAAAGRAPTNFASSPMAQASPSPRSSRLQADTCRLPMDDEDERRFLHLFRSLDSADRGVIEATMRAMSERQRAAQ